MIKENYLYFAEQRVETGNSAAVGAQKGGGGGIPGCDPEAALLPVSSYLGLDIATNTVSLKFKSANGHTNNTIIALTCDTANIKKVIEASTKIMNSYPHASGFVVFADAESLSDKKPEFHPLLEGLVTDVAITDGHICGT